MTLVRAAGGLVVREGTVLVVHRPKYDDWTFPKGKCEPGETDADCALREVCEETGLHCRFDEEIGTTDYVDARGRPKQVRWWRMTPLIDDGFTPNAEVDELRWLSPQDAARLLSYDRDVALLEGMT